MNTWGKHLISNLYRCNPTRIACRNNIYSFTKELVKGIDMKAYGEPQIVHFGTGNKAGYTLIQLIETSNISAHFCEEDGAAYLDIFSCKDFSKQTAEAIIKKYFEPQNVDSYIFERQARPGPLTTI